MANFGKPSMGTWARVLDTNALDRQQEDTFKQESYWPIGASQDVFSCIIVKVCFGHWVVTHFVSHNSVVVFVGDGNLSRVPETFPVRIAYANNFPR
jgi:hypothetical protein